MKFIGKIKIALKNIIYLGWIVFFNITVIIYTCILFLGQSEVLVFHSPRL